MATVLERLDALGFKHDKKIRSKIGMYLSERYVDDITGEESGYRILTDQTEDTEKFKVWNYPECWLRRMDELVWEFMQDPENFK